MPMDAKPPAAGPVQSHIKRSGLRLLWGAACFVVKWINIAVWAVTLAFWPLIRLVAIADVMFQLGRMAYHWNSPGVHAGWTAALHVAVAVLIQCYVGLYTPSGIKPPPPPDSRVRPNA